MAIPNRTFACCSPKSHRHISTPRIKQKNNNKRAAQAIQQEFDVHVYCTASTKVQPSTEEKKFRARPNSYSSGKPRGRSRTEAINYPPRRKPSPAEREMGGEGSQLVPSMRRPGRRPRRRLDWSGCWSWSGRATTPNCLGAAPWSLDGRPSPKKRHPSPSGNRRKEMEKGGIFI